MEEVIEFQEALGKGMIQKGHYFQTAVTQRSIVAVSEDETGYSENQDFITEAGETKLWRLVEVGKTAKECRLFGPPTKEKLTLHGKTGYENGIEVLDKIAAGTNVLPEFFTDVHSCRFLQREYKVKYREWNNFWERMQNELRKYGHKDDMPLSYFLASHCIDYGYLSHSNYFCLFSAGSGYLSTSTLYNSAGNTNSPSNAVRPEAIPKSNLFLKTDGCDGSKERPWVCVLAKEDTQTHKQKTKNSSKTELLRLIHEAQQETDMDSVQRKLRELEKYAKNLD